MSYVVMLNAGDDPDSNGFAGCAGQQMNRGSRIWPYFALLIAFSGVIWASIEISRGIQDWDGDVDGWVYLFMKTLMGAIFGSAMYRHIIVVRTRRLSASSKQAEAGQGDKTGEGP